jgi:protein ImuA
VAAPLSLVAGGGFPDDVSRHPPSPFGPSESPSFGETFRLPASDRATLAELFSPSPRDGGATGFLLAQIPRDKPSLWVQDRMAILESGRIHPPGLALPDLIHVEARDARSALWAMEEGLRCQSLGAVIGELWGDPAILDFTATRRLAVAAERNGVAAWLIRLGGAANLSGARMRWRIASHPSLANPLNSRAPGLAAWDAELFRARGHPPGRWSIVHEQGAADRFHLVAPAGDRTLAQDVERRTA